MADETLIYNALLRSERRLEATASDGNYPQAAELARPALIALQTLREEIGAALAVAPQ
jgi:acetaldehyde dehydrogenase (acetylating)